MLSVPLVLFLFLQFKMSLWKKSWSTDSFFVWHVFICFGKCPCFSFFSSEAKRKCCFWRLTFLPSTDTVVRVIWTFQQTRHAIVTWYIYDQSLTLWEYLWAWHHWVFVRRPDWKMYSRVHGSQNRYFTPKHDIFLTVTKSKCGPAYTYIANIYHGKCFFFFHSNFRLYYGHFFLIGQQRKREREGCENQTNDLVEAMQPCGLKHSATRALQINTFNLICQSTQWWMLISLLGSKYKKIAWQKPSTLEVWQLNIS